MLKAVLPASHNLGTQSLTPKEATMADPDDSLDRDGSDDEDGGKSRNKSRRELPAGAVATLKAWLLSPEHFTHPYPTPQDQVMLMQKTGIDKKQLKNWFTNARRRIWKPMLKKQLEQGKLQATGAGGGGVAVPGVVPGLIVPAMPGGVAGQDQQQYHQQMQGQPPAPPMQQQEVQVDQYGNQVYSQQSGLNPPVQQHYYDQNQGSMTLNTSIGSLPPMGHSSSGGHLSKTDSHAVLMELFARDQDLVRQATESAGLKKSHPDSQSQSCSQQGQSYAPQLSSVSSQHPMKSPSQGRLVSVPTLNSWPHFSSVSSLNNLGTMPGVKSITSLSGADLVKQGPVNTMSNLAQVKSVESMGRNDSYAFLEVFFGDRSSNALSSMASVKDQRGVKRERDEDNDVGLSLEDEGPSTSSMKKEDSPGPASDAPSGSFGGDKDGSGGTGTLKRAYDDALAARGLISVSRSCEKLTDLALPAKMQRTLSQELMRQQPYSQYQYSAAPSQSEDRGSKGGSPSSGSQQYPGQHPVQRSGDQGSQSFSSDSNNANNSVEVPSATKCAICHQTNVDTQLRPCGHMFHERCLKPSLQAPMGQPKCPVDHIPMQSALLAVPTDENSMPRPMTGLMKPQPASWSAPAVAPGDRVSMDSRR